MDDKEKFGLGFYISLGLGVICLLLFPFPLNLIGAGITVGVCLFCIAAQSLDPYIPVSESQIRAYMSDEERKMHEELDRFLYKEELKRKGLL